MKRTRRRAPHRALRRARQRLAEYARSMQFREMGRTAIRLSQVAAWQWDPVSDALIWHPTSLQIHDLRAYDWPTTGDHWVASLQPVSGMLLRQGVAMCLLRGRPFCLEAQTGNCHASGRWVEIRGEALCDDRGRVYALRGSFQDIQQRKEAEASLEQTKAQLRELAVHQEQAREDERRRLAAEIHDEMGQITTALRMQVAMAEMTPCPPAMQQHLQQMRTLIERAVDASRKIVRNLRPAALDLGLAAAVEWLAADFSRQSGVTCQVDIPDRLVRLGESCDTALFRLVQEALTNIAKHATATQIALSLFEADGALHLIIEDNGCGFDPAPPSSNGFGLRGMRQRVEALGGTLDIDSAIGCGTTIAAHFPCPASPLLEGVS